MRLQPSCVAPVSCSRLVVALVLVAAQAWLLARPAALHAQAEDTLRTTQFAVMANRFDREDPARVLADRLRKQGLSPYLFETQAANGTAVYAVRLDIFGTLLEALKAQHTLAQKSKLPLSITPGGSTEPIAPETFTLYVLTGEYTSDAEARKALTRLVTLGQESGGLIPLHEEGGPSRILVYAGTYASYPEAAKAAAKLSKKKDLSASVSVMDTALFITRQISARVAVPEAFAAQAAPPPKKEPKESREPKSQHVYTPPPPPASPSSPGDNATPQPAAQPAPHPSPVVPLPIPADAYPPPE